MAKIMLSEKCVFLRNLEFAKRALIRNAKVTKSYKGSLTITAIFGASFSLQGSQDSRDPPIARCCIVSPNDHTLVP